jgi:putative copper export protein/methionine-rich copper-binding protein CopC
VIAGARPAAARRPVLALLAVCLALVVGLAPRPASAHSTILSSTPRPGQELRTGPGVVALTFSQPLDIQLSRATVVAPNGQRFDQSSVSSDEIRVQVTTNAPGVYEVSWTSVSAVDGHTLSGGYRFGVDVSPAGAAVDAPLPGAGDLALAPPRALEYAGLLLAVGLLLLLQLAALTPRLVWIRTGLPVVLAATTVAGLAVVLGEAVVAAGAPSPGGMAAYLRSGPAGWTRLGRVAAEAAAVLVALRWPRLAFLPLGAALVALAASGHASAVQPAPLGVAVTVLHLASAGLWAGGILALAVQRPPGGWRAREGRRLLARFTPVALAAFSVTALTGVLQGAEELSGLGDLVATAYGQVLGLKALAVLVMVPLSVLAWRRLLPIPRLEAGLALVVVAASALLAAFPLPPARFQEAEAAQAGPEAALALPSAADLTMASSAGDVLVGLTLRPGLPGRNTAWLYVLPIGGEPAAAGLDVTVRDGGQSPAVRRCGPACRTADLDLRGGELLTASVVGAGTASFQVPALPAPDARGVVDRVQQVMHALRTYRLDETLRPAKVPLQVTYAFQAPDRLEYQVRGGGDTIIIGPQQFSRAGPDATWQVVSMPAVQVPDFIWDGAPANAAHELTASPDGALQVVSFYESLDGLPVWFELSVDGQGLVEQAQMRAQAHFMTHHYYDFDKPLTISPPTN